MDLAPQAQVFEDVDAQLDARQVMALPASRFHPATAERLSQEYSHSAYWLRFELSNTHAEACRRWLTVGEPRLHDIQVHVLRAGRWSRQVAGAAYPLEQWPVAERQPTFELSLKPDEHIQVLVRVTTPTHFLLRPVLWGGTALLQERQRVSLIDGITLGIVLLVVPFSLIVGWIVRSRLLAVHAVTVFGYVLVTIVSSGYLIFWPPLLAWSLPLRAALGIMAFMLSLAYTRELLQVRQLPALWGWLYNLLLLAFVCAAAWGLLIDSVVGRPLAEWCVRISAYILLPATLFAAWRRGLELSWMAWAVPGLLLVQFVVRYVLQLDALPMQTGARVLSLASTLPGVAILVCTLITEVVRSRRRERHALTALEWQQKAEQERLESTVAIRTGQLRESLRARSSLMARISHDLRSPLVSIIDYARLAQAGVAQDFPRKVERNARQQLELIDELLEFSRSELQQLELIHAPGYLYGFLHELEEEAAFLASRQNNRFKCYFADDLPALVRADFRRLRQVLLNLLGNAAKFTHDGLIVFEVSHQDTPAGQVLLSFSVRDSGIGIDAQARDRLLKPFQRGHGVEGYDGSGLGLSIVTQLLQGMDSELELQRLEPAGSRFSFQLALDRASEDELENNFVESHGTHIDGDGRRVLVVDDLPQNRDWLSDLLSGYGFDVQVAQSGFQALECLHLESFDLLISDMRMPGMDGWELLLAVRSNWPDLPVLLYSAVPALRPMGMPTHLRFDATLLKPASSNDLLSRVDTLSQAGITRRELS
ncbi:hybrid sensor histidine kinase/response regulator [Pseudomonas sp.]|uniref:hybrid sensor histidine kinase/response regulator n=1 Tax=Pseudomonas sp. TaxID=306 RepID=UPI002C00E91B|nr:7TM-DISM domain-containing protein [Pseudomonas sp.]HUE92466.1 7TM-DISM domain-containing protein [Pseudomonas sp.]